MQCMIINANIYGYVEISIAWQGKVDFESSYFISKNLFLNTCITQLFCICLLRIHIMPIQYSWDGLLELERLRELNINGLES